MWQTRRAADTPRWVLKGGIILLLLPAAADLHRPAGTVKAAEQRPPTGRPNIVLILADDLGFSDLGCYGGEIATPQLDWLAGQGLRFTQMYNTTRCWPTRACLLTGYYAQQVGRDPPENRPPWAALLPEMLRPAGYRSYHVGKWHIDGKVLEGGFDRSYWLEDWDRYFSPREHYLDDRPLPPVSPDEGYYATTAFVEYAIGFLREHADAHRHRPFFLYLAFTAPHFPLHALPEDIARYRGPYQVGWDEIRRQRWRRLRELGIINCELSPRDPALRPRDLRTDLLDRVGPGEIDHAAAWNELTPEQQRFQAEKMAIHAAMVDRMDREIGRLLEELRRLGVWDNTLIMFLSDNGADAGILIRGDGHDPDAPPGSARTFLCLGPGWATAANTPFRRHKIWVHEGGIATPCIVHYPAGIREGGELRHTPAHVIDFVPTVLDLAGLAPPASWNGRPRPPLPGLSLRPLFAGDGPLPRDHLYWHHQGNRAVRRGDWKLVSEQETGGRWELYDLGRDRGESRDLASVWPQRVAEMAALWQELDARYRADGLTAASPAP